MASEPSGRLFEILLVEDNPADVRLTQEALRDSASDYNLTVAENGEEAMEVLLKKGRHADAPSPDLVLLDLNLPRKGGREVLAEVKGDPNLRRIPVVVLTSSEAEQDVLDSYELQANSYISKSLNLTQFTTVIRAVHEYWREISGDPIEKRKCAPVQLVDVEPADREIGVPGEIGEQRRLPVAGGPADELERPVNVFVEKVEEALPAQNGHRWGGDRMFGAQDDRGV